MNTATILHFFSSISNAEDSQPHFPSMMHTKAVGPLFKSSCSSDMPLSKMIKLHSIVRDPFSKSQCWCNAVERILIECLEFKRFTRLQTMIISAPLAVAARAEPIDDANKREYSKLALICNQSLDSFLTRYWKKGNWGLWKMQYVWMCSGYEKRVLRYFY